MLTIHKEWSRLSLMTNTRPHLTIVTSTPARCPEHRAYEPDNCPLCGTARKIGG